MSADGPDPCPMCGALPCDQVTPLNKNIAADPARVAAEKIVRAFSVVCNMHVNDILPDIMEACAAKDAEIERLRAEIADLKDEQRALNQGAAHNANIDRSEIEFWKELAHGR